MTTGEDSASAHPQVGLDKGPEDAHLVLQLADDIGLCKNKLLTLLSFISASCAWARPTY